MKDIIIDDGVFMRIHFSKKYYDVKEINNREVVIYSKSDFSKNWRWSFKRKSVEGESIRYFVDGGQPWMN